MASASIVVGSTIYGVTSDSGPTLSQVIQHVSVAAAFFALFGYLARLASQHRAVASWAAVMVVQLKTFDAFCEDMSPEDRRALRGYFGSRVFSEVPDRKREEQDLAPTIQLLSELLRAQTKS